MGTGSSCPIHYPMNQRISKSTPAVFLIYAQVHLNDGIPFRSRVTSTNRQTGKFDFIRCNEDPRGLGSRPVINGTPNEIRPCHRIKPGNDQKRVGFGKALSQFHQ